jgi:acyl dehydratase
MALRVGDVLPELNSPTMDRMHLAYMTVAMRDPNLVHLEDEYAAQSGLPGVIAHGTFVVAYAGAAVSRAVGVEAIKHLKVDVTAPVFLGDVLRAHAEVVDLERSADGETATLRLLVTRQDGAQVGRGRAVVVQQG